MRWLSLFLIVLVTGCSPIQKLDYSLDKELLIELGAFNGEIKGGQFYQHRLNEKEFAFHIYNLIFKDEVYNSRIRFLNNAFVWEYEEEFNTYEILSERKLGNYEIKICSVTYNHPFYEKYGSPFKAIYISRNEGDFAIKLSNYSAFTDNVNENYLLSQLKKLNFKLRQKK
ncbi:hypothetical protein V1389_16815 [Flavobacterium rakeshii]|uniref:hypothetical protein n=1 Tax=Flavobacterium rakeshii TaxID=1038845 RepID=UPI002E7B24F0|nr:hypothetical protein [Flavobacterium rakeshii]MEE1900013.1 hypothetical protein [Flavobacterium rakeshii]